MANRWGIVATVADFIFLSSKITAYGDCSHKIKTLAPWKKNSDQRRQHIEKQRYYFTNKVPPSQSYGFSSSQEWMWDLDDKKAWVPKNWCFCTVVLEKPLESPLNSKEIKPVNPKGNQFCIFIRRSDAEAEALKLWPPDGKNWLIRKDPGAGKDRAGGGATENEMVRWHHQLDGHEFEQASGDRGGQRSLVCYSPWDGKQLGTTEQLRNSNCQAAPAAPRMWWWALWPQESVL